MLFESHLKDVYMHSHTSAETRLHTHRAHTVNYEGHTPHRHAMRIGIHTSCRASQLHVHKQHILTPQTATYLTDILCESVYIHTYIHTYIHRQSDRCT